jgi:hypothetical protein
MIYVYTFYTDDARICYLQESASLCNMQISYLKNDTWNGYIDKIVAMQNILQKHSPNDIICFIDAYDVLINQNLEYLAEKFNYYNCDLLIGAELNCFPDKYKFLYPDINSKYKYVNSGGYIGYKYALDHLFNWKSHHEIFNICHDGGDQSYFTEYFISNHSHKIKLDTECLIFQNMHLVGMN